LIRNKDTYIKVNMKSTRQFFLEAIHKIAEAVSVSDVLDTYKDWKKDTTEKLANWFAANKSTLDKLKKDMPKKFQPPIGKKAYRGSSIPPDVAMAILKSKAGKSPTIVTLSEKGAEKFIAIKNVPYTPHRKAQSWTLNIQLATKFTGPKSPTSVDVGVPSDYVGVVYEATIDNTFYLNPNAFSDYETTATNEQEVLRIGGKSNYTMYMRVADLPPDIALRFGGEKFISKFKKNLRNFVIQWFKDSLANKKNEDLYLKDISFDKKSGKLQIQTKTGSIMSVDEFFKKCEERNLLRKKSWIDGRTPYSRAFVNKTIAAYERGFASLEK